MTDSLPIKNYYPVGSLAAKNQLAHFLSQDVADYQTARDFPIKDQISKLSPYYKPNNRKIEGKLIRQ